jgi:hypothetical protein
MTDDLSRREALKAIGGGVPAVTLAPELVQQSSVSTDGRLGVGEADWLGKALVVYTRGLGPSMPVILTECRFESLGGRLFLAGVERSCYRWLKEWSEGARRRVAWEAVESFLVFDSLEEYHSRLRAPDSADAEIDSPAP